VEVPAFLWGFLVGVVFSTVGAAGGMLAGFGHMSLFGVSDANAVKAMNQLLISLSPLVSVPAYLRKGRLLLSLGLLLGLGSLAGALAGSTLSYAYLSRLQDYKRLFGLFTLFTALYTFYGVLKGEKAEIEDLERDIREAKERRLLPLEKSLSSFRYAFLGREISFNPAGVFAAGFLVSFVASALGVGGGFLLVLFMVSYLRVPMYLVPGTASLAVLVSSLASALNYLRLGAPVYWEILVPEALGVLAGSFAGPYASHFLGERKLRLLLGFLLVLMGLRYLLR